MTITAARTSLRRAATQLEDTPLHAELRPTRAALLREFWALEAQLTQLLNANNQLRKAHEKESEA